MDDLKRGHELVHAADLATGRPVPAVKTSGPLRESDVPGHKFACWFPVGTPEGRDALERNRAAGLPAGERLAWAEGLDVPVMQSAAKLFVGKHDFKSFAATRNYEMESTIRTLTRCELRGRGPLLTFVIEADGFLYKMCRGIVGTLVQVGRGKFSVKDIRAMLEARDRRAAGMTAPAHGLVLWKVFYGRKR